MKRRDLLVAGTALGSSGALSAFDRLALAQDAAGDGARALIAPDHRYEISLRGSSLAIDCFPSTSPAAARHALDQGVAAPLAAVGDEERPLSWTAVSWTEANRYSRALTLKAADHPLEADVSLVLDELTGLLVRRTVLRHSGGPDEVDLRATLGLLVSVHEPIEQIFYLTGEWKEEAAIVRTTPSAGAISLESRTGKTGFEFQPYVALRTAKATYLCQILWSGNWMLRVEPRETGAVVLGGFNNWRFRHHLRAGESLQLPTVLFGRFEDNLDGATRQLHDYRRAHRPDPERPMPVQFNSWYPFAGEPSAEALVPLIPTVKELGCEVFVVDAGWYRTESGESDADWDQRTGDWRVSRQRFPRGLRDLSLRCREAGLRFGLWFEPEVISPSSAIRQSHPEWLHYIDGKPPAADERAVLNLGVPEAWHHVFDRITALIRIIGIDWMKWDFNTDLGIGGWAPDLPEDLTGQNPLVAHYRGLYRLQDAIRGAFPDLILEMCAGGAGRMDGGILAHAHVNWMSDQSGALRKLAIHFGIQLAHPAVVCNDWLIDWPGRGDTPDQPPSLVDPRGDLRFRLRVAMLGTFGISAPVHRWTRADIATATHHVALYKSRLRAIIQHGDRYALTRSPPPDGNGDWAAQWFAAKDGLSGVLFAFRLAGDQPTRRFTLRGLHKQRRYHVRLDSGRQLEMTGEALENGLVITLAQAFESELCLVEAAGL
ncbi:alpha-galactosidase [Enhydrobacter aerosaccus]|uniref:Alpha-galactosidase n=1 Tax=Enhydrobacter aerosaccus TaxID=225324 RepID=A0A1T4SGD3_9HYPH|nr:alpha-galactosidase [Enhydrobacter aerosaccus]SKA26978.1 alpha-galactosidase [Enhydrobacter aerosaccus]